jgi:hypothetical protein
MSQSRCICSVMSQSRCEKGSDVVHSREARPVLMHYSTCEAGFDATNPGVRVVLTSQSRCEGGFIAH